MIGNNPYSQGANKTSTRMVEWKFSFAWRAFYLGATVRTLRSRTFFTLWRGTKTGRCNYDTWCINRHLALLADIELCPFGLKTESLSHFQQMTPLCRHRDSTSKRTGTKFPYHKPLLYQPYLTGRCALRVPSLYLKLIFKACIWSNLLYTCKLYFKQCENYFKSLVYRTVDRTGSLW